jgi:peptidoglycan/LPS O-acetylase OafA/YrhL
MALLLVVFLGEASFAFYLAHQSVIGLVGAGTWTDGVSSRTLALEAVNLGLAVAVAIGLYIGVERPARSHVVRLLSPRRRTEDGRHTRWDPPRPRPAAHANTRATPPLVTVPGPLTVPHGRAHAEFDTVRIG